MVCDMISSHQKQRTQLNKQRYNSESKIESNDCKTFEVKNDKKFDGILKYLSDESHGNILENGTVGITSTSVANGLPLRNLVDFQSTDYFRSQNDIQTICFDFKDKQIRPTNYSIQTGTDGKNGGHLKSWSIEVSNDSETWEEVDHRENESSLNGDSYSSIFSINKPNENYYRYIRLRQIGYPWAGKANYIEIAYIEFYGQLKLPTTK